jgi:hypothetical protein
MGCRSRSARTRRTITKSAWTHRAGILASFYATAASARAMSTLSNFAQQRIDAARRIGRRLLSSIWSCSSMSVRNRAGRGRDAEKESPRSIGSVVILPLEDHRGFWPPPIWPGWCAGTIISHVSSPIRSGPPNALWCHTCAHAKRCLQTSRLDAKFGWWRRHVFQRVASDERSLIRLKAGVAS